jgi:two-component system, chemotaxis family, CheB/CheR fusion protein
MSTRRAGGAEESMDAERRPEAGSEDPIVVGVGASAGGLEAFSRLLESLPGHTGMAFVLLQHLDPKHPSLLTQLLSAKTTMPVAEAAEGVRVAADHVYVAPAAEDLMIEAARLRLVARAEDGHLHLPIDRFFRSLAAGAGERCIGVVLSGAASDGVQGLAAIKSSGGLTFAQDPTSAEYSGMPSSAISARVVDYVLPPEEIAFELARLADGVETGGVALPLPETEGQAALGEVFALLRGVFGVDFSAYKLPTVRRRIARRMLVRRVDGLDQYVSLMCEDPGEVEALYRDILIMVTEFFREPETFAALRERIFPAILQNRRADAEVRIWVPGCASGEETYSLAITLLDVMNAQGVEAPIKIFATDISEPDLTSARHGIYAESISSVVAPDLLGRYFTRTPKGYQIHKAVRELCIFARHDVTRDPPFPNLDLVSCRNLLIYLSPGLQRWVIPSLHYGLRQDAYLVLGRSESITGFTELFDTIDKKQKIFRKLPGSSAPFARFPAARDDSPQRPTRGARATDAAGAHSLPVVSEADNAVLAGFAPPGVTVDAQLGIIEFRGDTEPYLTNRPGRPSLNLLDMVRADLAGKTRTALAEAKRTGTRTVLRSVRLGKGKATRTIDLHVIPFATKAGEPHYVVLFEKTGEAAGGERKAAGATKRISKPSEEERLRDELNETRERLEAVIQDKEAAIEELRAANEEMLSSAEEMQSVNEELETTQEELQSTNQELRSRNLELGQVSDDLSNLLASVSFPIIMVGRDLRIRQFTPSAQRLLKVIASDIGRLITDLQLRIDVPDLEQVLRDVIDAVAPTERDVQDEAGHWYAMQVRPYKTHDNRIDGAVVTLFDIDERKRLVAERLAVEAALGESETRLKIATEAAALGVHDHDVAAGIIGWDARVREIWGLGPEDQVTYEAFMSGVHRDDRESTQAAMDAALDPAGTGHYLATFRVLNAHDGSERWVTATGQALFGGGGAERLVGTVEDITERRRLEAAIREVEIGAAEQDERNRLARELHDSATQALFAATLKAESLAESDEPLSARAAETLGELQRLSRGALAQMRELLLELRGEPLEQIPIKQLLRHLVEAMEGRVGTVCEFTVSGETALPPLLHVAIYRIAQEALSNVSRHAAASCAWVALEMEPGRVRLRVEDDGRGFDPGLTVDPSHLGLRSMRERAEEADAAFSVGARPGGGTVITLDWTANQCLA